MIRHTEPGCLSIHQLQAQFEQLILPRVMRHGRVYFRHVKCPDRKEELLAEMQGLCWKWYVRLVRRGKNVLAFVSALATYAARAVNSGRRVCGHEKLRDVLSPVAQRKHHFTVGKLPDYSTLNGSPLEEALHDNTRTPPDEQAAFRIDFPLWLTTWDDRRRSIILDMAMNERTLDLANKYGYSPGRISQMRNDFHEDWRDFCEDITGEVQTTPAMLS
jgi:hypothetical protein